MAAGQELEQGSAPAGVAARLFAPRWALAGVFFVNGAGVGSLLPQLPYLQARLNVSKGVLGLCLLAMTAGALLAMPGIGQLLHRRGSRTVVRVAIVGYSAAIAFPLLAPTPVAFAALLFVVGIGAGSIDVSQNAHGAALERDFGRPIMSSLHAGWSLGGVAGAAGVALANAAGVDPRAYMVGAGAVLVVLGLCAGARIGHASAAGELEQGARFAVPPRAVIVLGVLCILVMFAEGSMNDWAALYLRRDLGTGAALASAAFAAFSAGMALGRITGDALAARIGRERLLRGGAALACVALGGVLLAGEPAVALPGVALVGLGVANGVPLLFSAAGRTAAPGPAIAAVSTMGYVAFLGGPPFLGFLADGVGLPTALATVCVGLAIVALARVRPARSGRVSPSGHRNR
jgi:MFS family permease